jgi:hypothetical protein
MQSRARQRARFVAPVRAGEHLEFIEQVFTLPYLETLPCKDDAYYYYYSCNVGYTDKNANSIGAVLDTTQNPRPFATIPTKYPPSKFTGSSGYYNYGAEPPDNE